MYRLRAHLIAIAFWVAAVPAAAAELVMFETAGCPYCIRWQRDVGRIYHLTDEGRMLRLRRVEIARPIPDDLRRIGGIRYTPTFVVMDDGREVGRIVGYLGEEQFWGLLGEILSRLKKAEFDEHRG